MWKLPNLATRRQRLWNFEMYKTYCSLSHCSCKQWWSLIIMTMMKRQRKETCLIVPLVRLSVPLSPHSWGTRGKHAAGAGNKPWMLRARNIQPGHYMLFMWVFVSYFVFRKSLKAVQDKYSTKMQSTKSHKYQSLWNDFCSINEIWATNILVPRWTWIELLQCCK